MLLLDEAMNDIYTCVASLDPGLTELLPTAAVPHVHKTRIERVNVCVDVVHGRVIWF
jgi:hypothetical protein